MAHWRNNLLLIVCTRCNGETMSRFDNEGSWWDWDFDTIIFIGVDMIKNGPIGRRLLRKSSVGQTEPASEAGNGWLGMVAMEDELLTVVQVIVV